MMVHSVMKSHGLGVGVDWLDRLERAVSDASHFHRRL